MKERPILFSAPMVRALLDGSKTQTRRIVKPAPQMVTDTRCKLYDGDPIVLMQLLAQVRRRCPYGQPGDRLWVREAWRVLDVHDHIPPREMNARYRLWYETDAPHQPGFGKYRPGMFMPRWASRITLEVTAVRIERLQDISETDALCEGIQHDPSPCDHKRATCEEVGCWGPTAKRQYGWLWEQINGKGSWDVNPWVWVVEMREPI